MKMPAILYSYFFRFSYLRVSERVSAPIFWGYLRFPARVRAWEIESHDSVSLCVTNRPRSGRNFLHIFLQFRIRRRFFKTYYHGFQIDWPRSGQHFSIYRHLIEKTIDFRLNFNLPCTYYPT